MCTGLFSVLSRLISCRRPKLTRETFKETIRRFTVAGGQAEAICSGPGPLCFAVIHAKDAEQVPPARFLASLQPLAQYLLPSPPVHIIQLRMRTVSDAVLGLGLDYGVMLMLWDAGDK